MSIWKIAAGFVAAFVGASVAGSHDVRWRVCVALAYLAGLVATDITIRALAGRQESER